MAEIDSDVLHFMSEDTIRKGIDQELKPWKIIVADDDEEVHAVTSLALSNFQFKGRSLEIISSYSALETEKHILENPDTAVILLDVVMENHDSGLELVKYIRERVGNSMVRIILRTGQPGYAPEMEVIQSYDINDYKEKTELTSSKLVTTLIASIRNYDDLQRIEEHRRSLEIVAANSAGMHGLDNKTPFDRYILLSIEEVLKSFFPDCKPSILNGRFDKGGDRNNITVCSGTGDFTGVEGSHDSVKFIPEEMLKTVNHFHSDNHIYYDDDCCVLLFKSTAGNERIIFIRNIPELSNIMKNILLTFSSHVSTVFNNLELMDDIRRSLDEKLILVKEIHHRVKNNLQIISSLLHMQSAGVSDEKLLDVLRESENRVQSMSLVHEKLYQSDLMATIDFTEYINSLAERLITTYNVSNIIKLQMDTDHLMLSINTAIPCGLIVNEILTNSIKYAFTDGREGIISISMKVRDEKVSLIISDNGIGLPADMNMSKVKSLGMKLIRVLTDQIDGTMELTGDEGTTFSLNFTESSERES